MAEKSPPVKKYAKSEKTKEKIRRTALRMIDHHGYESVSIQMICKECGIAAGLFYYYYKSKSAVLTEKSRECDIAFERQVNELRGEDPEQYLRDYFAVYAKINEMLGTELYIRVYERKHHDIRVESIRPIYVILEDYLRELQRKKRLRPDIHPRELVSRFYICVRGVTIDWCINDGKYDLNREIQMAITPMLFYYLLPGPPGGDGAAQFNASNEYCFRSESV